MDAKKVLLAMVAALLLLVGASVAYATNSGAPGKTSLGERGAQQVVADDEDANEAGETEDADEPGDSNGPGDTEDDD